MSSSSDVAGTGEEGQKERTPKRWIACTFIFGHKVKNFMTVIWRGSPGRVLPCECLDGALSDSA